MHLRQMWRKWGLIAAGLTILPATAVAQEQCITVGSQSYAPSEVYDTNHACGTCPGQRANPELCGAINRLIIPDWNNKSGDLITIPHRGFWGQPLSYGISENTQAALNAALAAKYHIVEIDVAVTGGTADQPPAPFLGHYFNMEAASGPKGAAPVDYTPGKLSNFYMRNRDASPNPTINNNLVLASSVIQWAKANHVLIMIDPKTPDEKDHPEKYDEIIALVLKRAKELDALANIAIKTSHTYSATDSYLKSNITDYENSYVGRFLWSPIPNKSLGITQKQTVQSIKDWHSGTNLSKQVVMYEAGVFSPSNWTANEFTDEDTGVKYSSLIDFIKKLTIQESGQNVLRLGKRSGLWSIDPMSDKGTLGSLYNWKFIGNDSDDKRGDPINNISYDLGIYAAVTTDRTDVYEGLIPSNYP